MEKNCESYNSTLHFNTTTTTTNNKNNNNNNIKKNKKNNKSIIKIQHLINCMLWLSTTVSCKSITVCHENISYPRQHLSILIFLTALCLFTHYRQMYPANNYRVLSHPHHTLCLALSQDEENHHKWDEIKEQIAFNWLVFLHFLHIYFNSPCRF